MTRETRYQAAILLDEEILLIKNHELLTGHRYWLLPGGGREPGETEIECVQREVREETNIDAEVLRLLLDERREPPDNSTYKYIKTYLCRPQSKAASPGFEPEPAAASKVSIVEVGWFNLFDENTWDDLVLNDPITTSILKKIRTAVQSLPDD